MGMNGGGRGGVVRPCLQVMLTMRLCLISALALSSAQAFPAQREAAMLTPIGPPYRRFQLTENTRQMFASTDEASTSGNVSFGEKDPSLTLVPLSREPLVFWSSLPVATDSECDQLRRYFEQMNDNAVTSVPSKEEHSHHCEAHQILQRIQQLIDDLTGCPSHPGEPAMPRFLLYEPSISLLDGGSLLPDGLHVDTNNGKFFRHCTVLLYLTSNTNGATTFPLARNNVDDTDVEPLSKHQLECDARHLIAHDVFHTSQEGAPVDSTQHLMDAAEALYHVRNCRSSSTPSRGIRVLPRKGHLCLFCNLDFTGSADPLSFHGGEALLSQSNGNGTGGVEKAVLTFFKEIPLDSFRTKQELGDRAWQVRQSLMNRYVRCKEHCRHSN